MSRVWRKVCCWMRYWLGPGAHTRTNKGFLQYYFIRQWMFHTHVQFAELGVKRSTLHSVGLGRVFLNTMRCSLRTGKESPPASPFRARCGSCWAARFLALRRVDFACSRNPCVSARVSRFALLRILTCLLGDFGPVALVALVANRPCHRETCLPGALRARGGASAARRWPCSSGRAVRTAAWAVRTSAWDACGSSTFPPTRLVFSATSARLHLWRTGLVAARP